MLPRINFYGNNFLTVFIEFPVYTIHLMSAPKENALALLSEILNFSGNEVEEKTEIEGKKKYSSEQTSCVLCYS
mgnify:CR=1 FL=1